MGLRKFRKVPNRPRKWIGGVCAGIAYAVGVPAWVLRIVFTVLFLAYGFGILPYLLLWIFLPKWAPGQPEDYEQVAAG